MWIVQIDEADEVAHEVQTITYQVDDLIDVNDFVDELDMLGYLDDDEVLDENDDIIEVKIYEIDEFD